MDPEEPPRDHELAAVYGNRRQLQAPRVAARADGYYDAHPTHDEIKQIRKREANALKAVPAIEPQPINEPKEKSPMGWAEIVGLLILLAGAGEAVRWLTQF
jgi:hypothetical protein